MGYAACWRPMQLLSPESELTSVRRARPLLGTLVEIQATADGLSRVHAAIDTAFEQVALVHRLMSRQDPDSELSRLNRSGAGTVQRVDPHTHRVLCAALRFARTSAGAFDPCVGGGSWQDIELLSGCCVRIKRPVCIDLGGIAKGYAVDAAIQSLQRSNVDEILVNAGGDLRAAGARTHEIHLRHPHAPAAAVNPLQLRNAALASSGTYFSRRSLVDPRSRKPYCSADAVSVRARDCMTADALTKIVLFAPSPTAERVLEEFGAEACVLRAGLPAQDTV